MLKRISNLLLALVLLLALTSCGSKDMSYNGAADIGGAAFNDSVSGGGSKLFGVSNSDSAPSYEGSYEVSDSDIADDPVDVSNVQGGEVIQKDMLVYKGSVSVTTKDYSQSMLSLTELYEKYDCFIESSREYTDFRYYDDTDLMRYEATVRVNSKDYKDFLNGIGDIGVVESKSSDIQNMNVEYSDTVTALRMQQARLERYLTRLETETDNEIALQLEREITSIQIEVQQLEARKRLIETDVAYSYVNVAIREVRAYSSQVTHSDPLYTRVWAEIVNTYYEFTEFLVEVLFFLIHAFPYIVILVILFFVFRKKFKGRIKMPRLKRKHAKTEDVTPKDKE